jgi:hypothetical protein
MIERALTFGSAASAYERFRPGYPDELVDEVLAYAGGPLHAALEIGAGTGKATRAFAGRGITVTASEPDRQCSTNCAGTYPAQSPPCRPHSRISRSPRPTISSSRPRRCTGPSRKHRWSRIAAMLTRDGIFAAFGGQMHLADPAVEQAVRIARSQLLESDDVRAADGTSADVQLQWPGTELTRPPSSRTCANRASNVA